jgi:hypothetical protein
LDIEHPFGEEGKKAEKKASSSKKGKKAELELTNEDIVRYLKLLYPMLYSQNTGSTTYLVDKQILLEVLDTLGLNAVFTENYLMSEAIAYNFAIIIPLFKHTSIAALKYSKSLARPFAMLLHTSVLTNPDYTEALTGCAFGFITDNCLFMWVFGFSSQPSGSFIFLNMQPVFAHSYASAAAAINAAADTTDDVDELTDAFSGATV